MMDLAIAAKCAIEYIAEKLLNEGEQNLAKKDGVAEDARMKCNITMVLRKKIIKNY